MKGKIVVLVLIIAGLSGYYYFTKKTVSGPEAPKQAPITLKKHSEGFNKSVDSLVSAYLSIKNAFVEGDTALAKQATKNFIAQVDRLPINELKKDTTTIFETVKGNLADVKANANSLLQQQNITEMRKDFSMVTEMLYPSFFTSINYEGQKLFVENCPMAFDDSVAASWISSSAEIVNPYLGKNHPKYKSGMLSCGDVKDSILAK